jgi:hypothetical protein
MDDNFDVVAMGWYWVEYIMRSEYIGKPRKRVLYERAVLLLRASDPEHAAEQGRVLAESKEHSYVTARGEDLRWVLDKIERVEPVLDDTIMDGTEVYSHYYFRQSTEHTKDK